MPEPNIPLLRKAVEWVEEQDKLPMIDCRWLQGEYVVSPERVARLMVRSTVGGRLRASEWEWAAKQLLPHCGTGYCVAGYIGQLLEPRYRNTDIVAGVHVGEFAQKQLGITDDQAEALFDGSNKAETVRLIAQEIAGEPL